MFFRLYPLLACFLSCFTAYSQEFFTIRGTVMDKMSRPVAGASIHLLNSNDFAITDSVGKFMIRSAEGDCAIEISAVGYAAVSDKVRVTRQGNNYFSFQLAEDSKQLDEVIVSAEKREENIQNIPLSLSAFSRKNIEDLQMWTTHDLTAVVPNLYSANPGDGRNVTSIRGIASTSYDPSVTTYIDGVNQFTLDTYMPQLFDVERIEVLRGPQGTLYGRNAMGGVINIVTVPPSNKTTAVAEISVGNFGQQRYTAAFRTPLLRDKLFFGASFLYDAVGGYYSNEYTHSKFDKLHGIGGNYYLKYLPGEGWALTLNAKHLVNRNYGSFPLAPTAAAALADPFVVDQNAIAKLVDNTFDASFAATHSGPGFNFSTQTSYESNYRYYATPIDGDFSPADAVTIVNNYGHKWNNVKVITEEIRFTSPASNQSSLKWTAGAYLFYQNVPNKQATHFGKDAALVGSPDSNYSVINTTRANSTGVAIFAQASQALSKKADVIFGIRYDYQHSKEEVLGEYQPDASPVPVFQTQPDTTGRVSYNAVSPRVSFEYSPAAGIHLFATYSRGYRTGGLTQLGLDPSQPPLYAYQPEYSDNFELGMKNMFFNHRLRANLSIFYTKVSNAQVPTLVLPAAITITKNAGRLASKGLDLEMASKLTNGLDAMYNFGYTRAIYSRLKVSQNGSEVDLSGNRQVFTPVITSLLALKYTVSLVPSQAVRLVIRGEWSYLGKEYFDLANTVSQSPYSLWNARFGVAIKHAELYLWARNMANVKYIAYAYDFGAAHLGNPRTFGFTLKLSM